MATKNLKILTCSRKQTTGPRFGINKNEAEKGLDKKWLFAKNTHKYSIEGCTFNKPQSQSNVKIHRVKSPNGTRNNQEKSIL